MRALNRIIIYRVLPILVVLILMASAVISLNERYWHTAFVPSWKEIYTACGFIKPMVADDDLHVTVLDVGNADCILLQSGDSHVLIDAGGVDTTKQVVDFLYASGVERFDCIIATHFDEDHAGGMADVLQKFGCDRFWMPSTNVEGAVYDSLMPFLREHATTVLLADLGQTFSFGLAQITILSQQKVGNQYRNDNDESVVCRVTFGKHAFLFMADVSSAVEQELMQRDIPLSADVIKVSHHGSKDATSPNFIKHVKPTYAVISCREEVLQQHPHRNTLATLRMNGVTVYRTDIHGKIFICSDGETLSVTGEYK